MPRQYKNVVNCISDCDIEKLIEISDIDKSSELSSIEMQAMINRCFVYMDFLEKEINELKRTVQSLEH